MFTLAGRARRWTLLLVGPSLFACGEAGSTGAGSAGNFSSSAGSAGRSDATGATGGTAAGGGAGPSSGGAAPIAGAASSTGGTPGNEGGAPAGGGASGTSGAPSWSRPFDWVGVIGTGQSLAVGVGASYITSAQPYGNLALLDRGSAPQYPLSGGQPQWSVVPLVEPMRSKSQGSGPGYGDGQYPQNIFGETHTLAWRTRFLGCGNSVTPVPIT